MASDLEIYVWPGGWKLPSMDPASLSLIMYLQMILPGKFAVLESVNPDLSPTGQLPYLKNGDDIVSPLSSIVKYISNHLKETKLAVPFDQSQKCHSTAWIAHAESNLGNLVFHMFYSLHANWNELTHPSIVYRFPIPQRYYAPHRIRESFKARLEAAGLWSLPGVEQEKKKNVVREGKMKKDVMKPRDRFLQVFEREKVLEKSRSILDIYARLLENKQYFEGASASLLDAVVAAHILLLLYPPFPDPLVQELLKTSYPSLVSHANLMYELTIATSNLPVRKENHINYLLSLFPLLRDESRTTMQNDLWLVRLRLGFLGLGLGGMFAFLYSGSR